MIRTRDLDIRKLNSLTKYPSISTYHTLGERGALLDEVVSFGESAVILTEKVDGTNSRIVLMPDGYFLIGSREEFLFAKGDLIHNPALGIVEALQSVANRLDMIAERRPDAITTVYVETYGGKTTAAAKQYTSRLEFGVRLFDVSRVPISVLENELERIATWRENNGQEFLDEVALHEFVAAADIELTPRLHHAQSIPFSIEDTHEWLKRTLPSTLVALDEQAGGRPEGVVVRTPDRTTIAKIRFEDYERHARTIAKRAR